MTSSTETVYQSDLGKTLMITSHPENSLLVADSWLVREGGMIALELHQQRFFNSCYVRHGIDSTVLQPLWQEALGLVPVTGTWFPRMELAGNPRQPVFQCRIRPAPPIRDSVKLMVCHTADVRQAPRHKGPDIPLLGRLRHQVLASDADEGLITTSQGFLLEGLTSSILWWEKQHGQDVLCAVPDSNRILPGTIRRLMLAIAEKEGIPIAYRLVRPKQLDGCDVWSVNALHGIRPAIIWEKAPFVPQVDALSSDRLAWWRQAISRYAVRL
ncbi:MAG: aminotransferase class IV [Oxalobacter sp.]